MGDKYNVGQGIAGRSIHAHDITFNQQWNEISHHVDLLTLAKELSLLRAELRKEATESEHDIAIGAIASAEKAAKEGNGAKALEALKDVGNWAIDVATKIGVSVAAEAIKKASGF
jgi:hypothetical protein